MIHGSKSLISGLLSIFLLASQEIEAGPENFEFPLSHPMLITSLRQFDKVSENFHIFRSRNGSIILRAEPGHGIMAVVQEMNLQEIRQQFSFTPNCLDYIKFSQVEGSGGATKEICGHLEHLSGGGAAETPAFLDTSGFLELDYVLTEKSRISPLDTNITNFNISFTPFQECPEDAFPFGNAALRPCSLLDTFSCISASFFCDGVVNCAFPQEFGLDEQNCPLPEVDHPPPEVLEFQEHTKQDNNQQDKEPEDAQILTNEVNETEELDMDQLAAVRLRIFHYGRQANASIFATLTIFVILLGLIKMRGRGRPCHSQLVTPVQPYSIVTIDKCEGAGYLMGESEYDPETDPVPSYEDCLLLDTDTYSSERPVYSALSIEHERPPSYEEVRVHSWTQKFRI